MLSYSNFLTLGGSPWQRQAGAARWWNTMYQPAKPTTNGSFSHGPALGRSYTNHNAGQYVVGRPPRGLSPVGRDVRRPFRNSHF